MPDPGWYDDPEDATQLRWWDGARWTDRRQPRAAVEPPPPPPPVHSPPPTAGTSYGIPLGGPGADPGPQHDPWGSGPSSTASAGTWGTGNSGSSSWGTDAAGSTAAGGGWGGAVATGAAPPRTFVEAIKVCFTKYVDGKGRASRSEYWYFALFTLILDLGTAGYGAIFVLLPSITVSVRRLHDIGKSAWNLLWFLLPFIGWIVLIVYAVRPGEPHVNRFG